MAQIRFDFLVTPGPMVTTNSTLDLSISWVPACCSLSQSMRLSHDCASIYMLFHTCSCQLRLVEGFPSELTAGVLSCWNITLRDAACLMKRTYSL